MFGMRSGIKSAKKMRGGRKLTERLVRSVSEKTSGSRGESTEQHPEGFGEDDEASRYGNGFQHDANFSLTATHPLRFLPHAHGVARSEATKSSERK